MSNNTTPSNPPAETLRDGSLKATIWRNEGESGPYFTTTFAKTYETQNGKLRDTTGFTGPELLRVAELARAAYAHTITLRRDPEPQGEQSREEPEPRRSGGGTSQYARRRSPDGLSDHFPSYD